jgi:hypothetical protein
LAVRFAAFLSYPLRTVEDMESMGVEEVVEALTTGVDALGSLDLDALTAREAMTLTRAVEVVRRRLDAQTDRLSGHLQDTGKFGVDGHRSAKDAITYVGRLPSDEAHNRVLLFRRLAGLPKVADAYERGLIATEAARAIARLAANPRVAPLLDDVIDDLFVEQATTDSHQGFTAWLRDLERAADADGAAADAERTHQRRRTTFTHNAADDSYQLRTDCGSLQGAVLGEVLAAFELAELEADRAEAIATHGPDATPAQYRRTPTQRRTDPVVAIFLLAAAAPSDVVVPDPVVNVVIGAETLEDELARVAGTTPTSARASERRGERRVDEVASRRICRTLSGRPLDPSDVVACLLVGHVRRVVVDSTSTVIDLGRKRRCFTGSARDAADLRAAIRRRGASMCFWGDCTSTPHRQQRDHVHSWRAAGTTNTRNSDLGCGYHNRLKETGYRPVRRADGRYDLLRPDGTRITPPA